MKPLPVCDNTGDKITPGVDGLTAYDQNACGKIARPLGRWVHFR